MTWIASILVGFLAAAAGCLAAGATAILAVDWYHVPGFEGESGYFVAGLAVLGLLAGFCIGVLSARVVAAGHKPGFLKALLVALAAVWLVVGMSGGVARALADVPPEIGGETLLLAVEVRYWADRVYSPLTDSADGYVELHSIADFSHTVRASARGPLWKRDATVVDGRWVVPGAVEVFTSRGSRMLEVAADDTTRQGFLIDLPGHPGAAQLAWSEWLPRQPVSATKMSSKFELRFRVLPVTQPIRSQTVGPFEVLTIASGFYRAQAGNRTTDAATARFSVKYHGAALMTSSVTGDVAADSSTLIAEAIATVGGTPGALIVLLDRDEANAGCYLLSDSASNLRAERLGDCGGRLIAVSRVTTDSAEFRQAAATEAIPGQIDTVTFAHPGLYLFAGSLFDSRSLRAARFASDTILTPIPSVPPLGVSPDQRSFVRFGYRNGSSDSLIVCVTDFVADRSYSLPVDPRRMRYPTLEALDPAWLLRHFTWQRGADGVARLVQRPHFVPLAWRGELSGDSIGPPSYRIEKAGDSLRSALVAWMVGAYRAEPEPVDSGAYERKVRIGGETVTVAASSDFGYVLVSRPPGVIDSGLVADIARRFNRELATGRYDSLFTP